MGAGVMALATQMTAARAVAEHNGEVVPTLTALLARTGERK